MLKVEGLHSGYGAVPVLHSVSFDIAAGQCTGIIGNNGSGKTTLMKTIVGHLPASAGSIRFEGTLITCMAAHQRARHGIAIVPQGREIFGQLTVRENLETGLVLVRGKSAREAALDEILEELPRLKPILDRRGSVLSGGEQQILALARALCTGPKLLILDEPTEGIQPSINDEIIEILKRLRISRCLTILLVEQKLDFLTRLVDCSYVIQRGQITQLLDRPALSDMSHVHRLLSGDETT